MFNVSCTSRENESVHARRPPPSRSSPQEAQPLPYLACVQACLPLSSLTAVEADMVRAVRLAAVHPTDVGDHVQGEAHGHLELRRGEVNLGRGGGGGKKQKSDQKPTTRGSTAGGHSQRLVTHDTKTHSTYLATRFVQNGHGKAISCKNDIRSMKTGVS